ncbi:NAD(P)H-binding protein [Janibacter terrae]|uniref:NAD(P)H-binding protein n=1 Tax=Janibacter terrae TaxID=103817 RepID=UPI0008305C69|nr:NAD(P)H-binding protein [Janibacter terrae]
MSRIVLIGGHGKVALLLAPILVEQGHEVTSVIRNPDHAAEIEATGATARVADVEQLDVPGLAEVLEGHDAVVWSAGAGGGDPQRTYAVDPDNPFFAYAEAKAAADEHLRGTDLEWTVLGPSGLTLEPASGSIDVGEGGGTVSRANVARVVAATLADSGTVRRTIEFHDGATPIAEALR